jgi:hypothetical protein
MMAAAYGSVVVQMRAHAAQTMVAETTNQARQLLGVLTDQIALAGFGVPTASKPSVAPSVVVAAPQRLSFWTNVATTHTYLTANAAKGDGSVSVLSTTGLKEGMSVYLTDTHDWYSGSIKKVSNESLTLSSSLSYNFALGSLLVPIELVTIELVDGNLLRNGHVLATDVADLQFSYDAEDPADVRVITLQLTLRTRQPDPSTGEKIPISTTARVAPRNLAL